MEPFITLEPDEIDENLRRPKNWFYPVEAIRELMVNALVHRDWSRFVDVEINGYKNRMEITSPGSLPNAITVEKMLAGQRSARNNLIVEVMRDYGYVDARGMGIRTKVLPALKKAGTAPRFHTTEDYVRSVISKIKVHSKVKNAPIIAPLNAPLTKLQTQLLHLIQSNPEISYNQMAAETKKNRTTIMRNIAKLKDAGILQRTGSKRTGHWEILEKKTRT